MEQIQYNKDAYNGIIIFQQQLPQELNVFEQILMEKLIQFEEQKINAVWLYINIDQSNLIPVAVKHGFQFHHAQPQYVLMLAWVNKQNENGFKHIPQYSTHYIGSAGIVIDMDKKQILVVRDKFRQLNEWSFPGGMANQNEFLSDSAIREVYEETGIQCEFIQLLSFRETLQYRFGQSDIYFLCILKPNTFEITKCDVEIQEAKWLDLEEFFNISWKMPFMTKVAILIKQYLENQNNAIIQTLFDSQYYGKTITQTIYSSHQ